MTRADQLNSLVQDIDAASLPDADDIVRVGHRRRSRRRIVVAAVAALILGVGALATVDRPTALTPARHEHPAVDTIELRTAATLDVDNPTDAVAARGSLWVVGGNTRILAEVNPAQNTVTRQVTLPHPATRVAATDDSLWVASGPDNVVMKVDRSSLRVTNVLSSGPSVVLDQPGGITVVGNQVWVTNYGSNPSTAVAIDDRSALVSRVVTLPGTRAAGPVVDPNDRTSLWFSVGSPGVLVEVSALTGRLANQPGPGAQCGQVQLAYMSLVWSSGDDPACATTTREIDTTGAGYDHTYAPGLTLTSVVGAGGQLWASDHSNTIYRVDRDTGAATPTLTLQGPVTTNRMLTVDDAVWVMRDGTNQLVKLEPFMSRPASTNR
jgi:streptogramin lyase